MDKQDIVKQCLDKLQSEMKSLGHVNIVVAGKTGVGKSTLVNSLFRERLSETGIGAPVTDSLRELTKEGLPLRVYDTVGLVLGEKSLESCRAEISALIQKQLSSGDDDRYIHCIWYCVSVDSNRLEPAEEEFIKTLAESSAVPIIIVLTLAHNRMKSDEMRRYVEGRNLPVKRVIPVLSEDYVDYEYSVPAYGREELAEFTAAVIPESAQRAFVNAQGASLALKRRRARSVVMTTAATGFGEGFIPLPFADATLLVPTQIGMIASITAIYGVSVDRAMITALASSLLGTAGATIAGRTLASGLLKLIPGAGTLAGGVISGATASIITTALGETYIGIVEALVRGELNRADLSGAAFLKRAQELFKENLKVFSSKRKKRLSAKAEKAVKKK